ncbi:tetratricopeptide repeat protein [Pseudosulfitobacter koreensis]|uniref:Tetratricopeptide repeat protein n=1 Tax=Pseudosulfitobacter koreensis TaxID=2968472 RepID=A0ABT1YZJ8_9RHOB|nr:tetratricopeptide repeat protein [Pseudosulfitobacter koreense]MCR8826310.1 tetratricopeptide repeat protein [Pseudosulfitobacter koreense]
MLEQLQTAEPGQASQIERELERTWSQSGSVAMNMLLERGRKAMEDQDYSTAIDHLTALTDHAPTFAEGYHARAMAYYRSGRYGPAFNDLWQSLALNPDNYNAIFGLGMMLLEFEDTAGAAQAFSRVLELNPGHERAKDALKRLEADGIGRTL